MRKSLLALLLLAASVVTAQTVPSAATWRRALGARAIAAPAAQAGSVVIACDDGSLQAYGSSGASLWRWDAGGKLHPTLARSREGTSYVVVSGDLLVAVNRSGRELWRRPLGEGSPSASFATGWDGRLFVVLDKAILCFTEAGFCLWKRQLPAGVVLPPVLDAAGGLALILSDGRLLRSSPFGELSFHSLPRQPTSLVPLPASNEVPEPAAEIAVGFSDGTIEAYSRTGEGRPLAKIRAGAAALRAYGRFLAYALADGEVGLLEASGKTLWMGTVPQADGGSLHLDERGVYYLSRRGSAGFSYDGRRLWNVRIDGAAAPPALGDEGLLFSGGDDWLLYAYRVEERIRSDAAPRYGPPPPGTYGLGLRRVFNSEEDPFYLGEEAVNRRFDRIERGLAVGDIGAEERGFTEDLMIMASSAPPRRPGAYATSPAIPPHLRERAVVLLSRFASPEAIPFLLELFERDEETYVRAAAAEAIGRIGIDPGGRSLAAFASAIFPPRPVRDDRLLVAVAAATGALCRFSGPPLSDAGISILIALAADGLPPAVRERARTELASLTSPR